MSRPNSSLEWSLIEEFGTATFSTRDPEHKSLGWAPGPSDSRDWRTMDVLAARNLIERRQGLQHWVNPLQLDQGSEGSCVGFGTTGVINAAPQTHSYGYDFAYALYKLAQTFDPWPGENYEGTSVRAGGMAGVHEGHFSSFSMTYDTLTLALWVLNYGPATIGVDWYSGMDRVDEAGYVHPKGSVRGGHCVVIDGVVWNMKGEENRFRFRNSWGPDWGFNGRGRIHAEDLQFLLDDGGVACTPTEAEVAA